MSKQQVYCFDDQTALYEAAAERFVALSTAAIRDHGRFSVALSGGSTPVRLYRLLAEKQFRSRVSWKDVFAFWGDERCVPPDQPESNYRSAFDSLLVHVPIPATNIFRIRGEIDPAEAAIEYEQILRDHFNTPEGAPRFTASDRFDLICLGLGEDGHTASLFPGGDALEVTQRWVTASYSSATSMWRVTFTLPLINSAANVQFLVKGRDKHDILARIIADQDVDNAAATSLPASRVRPPEGTLEWLVDSAAMPDDASL